MKTYWRMSLAVLMAVTAPAAVQADQNQKVALADVTEEVAEHLERFQENPFVIMNEIPEKRDAQGNAVADTLFSPEEIQDRSYVDAKDDFRKKLCMIEGEAEVCLEDVEPGRAPIAQNDQVERLAGTYDVIKTLEEMEREGLLKSTLDTSPWSDNYWPIYQGILGARYADYSFPADSDWKKNRDYVRNNPALDIFRTANSTSIDNLSPAEKYDLLVGDSNMTLTEKGWAEGQRYYDLHNKVESWMGVCHGWAPAAYMLPRATNAVKVMAADGRTELTFYPSDIKALATHLWANARTPSLFIGGRCNDKDAEKDENGRITSQDCFDNNPGAWHMAVTNLIGKEGRSFILDATYDYEVWNQPIYKYEYTYFNPATRRHARSLDEAKVRLSEVRDDKFASYRSRNAEYLVGIVMDLTYVVETQPSHRRTDSARYDAYKTVRYYYDLELDRNGKIIGGEWYSNAHPDFLWTPPEGTRAESAAERYVQGGWDGTTPVPYSWKRAATAASRYSQPLANVVETLIALSRAQGE